MWNEVTLVFLAVIGLIALVLLRDIVHDLRKVWEFKHTEAVRSDLMHSLREADPNE